MNKIEILAPAGDINSVKAAVLNGADAIYIGAANFSARKNANNFSDEDLLETVAFCHARNVLVHLTLNTIVFDYEFEDLIKTIKSACNAGVDAFIIQDMGVLSIVQKIAPKMPIHASTQMAVHTVKGAELLYEMGVSRVVLARELTLKEIAEIAKAVPIETEVFVHGALCMSVSGQCYISGMVGGRSGNRGNCAGTCRLEFKTADKNETHITKPDGEHALSLKDNCLIEQMNDLINAGVTSLKIEGRMKRPEYVAASACALFTARENILKSDFESEKLLADQIDRLQAVFSRSGFTNGYLTGKMEDMFGYRRFEDVISATDKIFKELQNTYKKEVAKIPLCFTFKAKKNEPIFMQAQDFFGNSYEVFGENPQDAINVAINAEYIEKLLKKLGGTIFTFDNAKYEIGENLSVPASQINEMRRTICEQILRQREKIIPVECDTNKIDIPQKLSTKFDKKVEKQDFRARFASIMQIPFEKIDSFSYIILPIDEVLNNTEKLLPYAKKVIIEPDRIMFLQEENIIKKLSSLKKLGFYDIMAQNIAHIKIGKDLGFIIHGGTYLNCANSYSINAYQELGIADQTISFETQIKDANKISSSLYKGIICYGYLPLMIMKNCPIKNEKSCKECGGNSILIDRMSVSFRVICHNKKYCEVVNSTPLYMAERLTECNNMNFLTLYFTTETKLDVSQIISLYENRSPSENLGKTFTRGLYYRPI